MPGVKVFADEHIEKALRKFKKQVDRSGVIAECRKREHYEKPSVKKKHKRIAARKRLLKKSNRREQDA